MARRLLLTALLLLLSAAGFAQSIAYTVQVVAVSDQAQAFSLIRELGVDGYPAYATRATTDQGDVVRVRVGGFANRAAALLYAETMPDFPTAGSRPLPALADNIPQGVMPFEPRLLFHGEASGLTLLQWGDQLALRSAAGPAGPHTYRLLADGNSQEFTAWSAWPEPDGLVLRYRDEPLWPEGWQQLEGELLQLELTARLDFIAERLGVSTEELRAAIRDRDGLPVLVVLERFNPWLSLEVGQLLAVRGRSQGPESEWSWSEELLGGEIPEPGETVLLELESASELPVRALQSEQWSISFDDPFMLQSLPGSTRSWRAAVGAPLWTDGSFVLARHDGLVLLYDFLDRR